MLIHPIQITELYPIGSIIETNSPPNDAWMLCAGQVLAQADYLKLYSILEDPHPIFQKFMTLYDADIDLIYEVVYGSSKWVGCGDAAMFYSSDGEAWTKVTLPTYTDVFYNIDYNGSIFVAVSYGGNHYVTSTDGINWTERTFPAITGKNIVWNGTYFYVAGSSNAYNSTDGINWTAKTALSIIDGDCMAANASIVIAKDWSWGNFAISTDNMTTWKFYEGPSSSFNQIEYDSGLGVFYTGGDKADCYGFSEDGVDWEWNSIALMESGEARSLAYYEGNIQRIRKVGDYFFVVPYSCNQALYSKDLKTWNSIPLNDNLDFYDTYYKSSTDDYFMIGYGEYFFKWDNVINRYNVSTHFMLPTASRQHDLHDSIEKPKYIRVK